MGDEVLRVSLLVQRGQICQACGETIEDELEGHPRRCSECSSLSQPALQSDTAGQPACSG